ncbi:MAG: DUF3460 family protein [Rhodocyclaceae bacterium]|nr:DUF3460 family protein [Rhodocyclaceae bacterium]
MTMYESDTTRFIRDLLKKHPEVIEKQKKHRATWWERKPDPAPVAQLDAAKVPRHSYEYYPFAGK